MRIRGISERFIKNRVTLGGGRSIQPVFLAVVFEGIKQLDAFHELFLFKIKSK